MSSPSSPSLNEELWQHPSVRITWCNQNISDKCMSEEEPSSASDVNPCSDAITRKELSSQCQHRFFSKWKTFMDLIAPLTSVQKTLFLPTWSEDVQGPTILWLYWDPFLSLHLSFALSFIYGLSVSIFSLNPAIALPPLFVPVMKNPELTPSPQSLALFFSLLPSCNEGWIQQVTFQFFSDLIGNVALQTDMLKC